MFIHVGASLRVEAIQEMDEQLAKDYASYIASSAITKEVRVF